MQETRTSGDVNSGVEVLVPHGSTKMRDWTIRHAEDRAKVT